MDFLNIGGGELLVIVLLALILFRPEDIYKGNAYARPLYPIRAPHVERVQYQHQAGDGHARGRGSSCRNQGAP